MKDEAIPNRRLEGRRGLPYISNRPRAIRCDNRGSMQKFSGHVYDRDGTNCATSLPRRLAGRALRKTLRSPERGRRGDGLRVEKLWVSG